MIQNENLPSGWKIIDLKEIVFFQEGPGIRKWQFTNEGIKLINVKNIINGRLNLHNSERHCSVEEVKEKYTHFLLEENDIVMATSGVTWGKTAIIKNHHLPLMLNTSVIRFRSLDKSVLSRRYLLIFLNSIYFKKQIEKMITGGCQPNFGPYHLKKVKMILPPLETQIKIVEILKKAEKLKEWRAEADKLTEQFLKSIFFEMFGDVGKNPKGWDMIEMKDLIFDTKNENPSKEYPEKTFKYIDISSIDGHLGKIIHTKEYFGKDAPSRARQIVQENDLLISTVRPNLNAVALVPKKLNQNICSTGFCILRPKTEKINSTFLFYVSRSNYFIEFLINKCRGANYPAVTNKDVHSFKVPVPPLELQNQFANIVKQIESLKSNQPQSKKEIDNLYNTLIQKAFKGELTC